ncbi:MAG: sarcosine oxidase subunit alpha [Thermoprotei archaeon]|nr:MAG: sarcosine oxidase subunit alpha [Thermoprotei archaeon]
MTVSRIIRHPILDFKRGKKSFFYIEDKLIEAYENESVLAALYANGIRIFSQSRILERPRGAFCLIGKCSSCLMEVDGIPNTRICITLAKNVKKVRYQESPASPPRTSFFTAKKPRKISTDVLVIGSGPAGLYAAIYASKYGANVILVDENPTIGGQLIKQTHKFFGSKDLYSGIRGFEIAKKLAEILYQRKNVKFLTNTTVFGLYSGRLAGAYHLRRKQLLKIRAKQIIVATGASERFLVFENNDLPGVIGAGAAQTLMNVYGVKPGEKALMVGAGNVGLIVSYQLIQAGVKVVAIVEAMPRIGGYLVHAAKVRRLGVPIYISHTIKSAHGKEKVEGATIIALDNEFREIPGTEKYLEVDLICLAVGLNPYSQLLSQAGCEMVYVPELGGLVPKRTRYQETTISGIYVAGDVSGIEEASTAMLEGGIAGISAALKITGNNEKALNEREEMLEKLEKIRAGRFFERIRKGLKKVLIDERCGNSTY